MHLHNLLFFYMTTVSIKQTFSIMCILAMYFDETRICIYVVYCTWLREYISRTILLPFPNFKVSKF